MQHQPDAVTADAVFLQENKMDAVVRSAWRRKRSRPKKRFAFTEEIFNSEFDPLFVSYIYGGRCSVFVVLRILYNGYKQLTCVKLMNAPESANENV